jgi:hypothetical protein
MFIGRGGKIECHQYSIHYMSFRALQGRGIRYGLTDEEIKIVEGK